MARKPTSKTGGKKAVRRAANPGDAGNLEQKVIGAALTLAARQPWHEVTLSEIAAAAKVSFADVVAAFPDKAAIVRAFMRQIDKAMLAALDGELGEEPARERLLDVMIARLEAMAPHKEAIRSIVGTARRDPCVALALAPAVRRSAKTMLAGAQIATDGIMGEARLQGAMAVFARGLATWLGDDDAGMARTMARLDRALRDGEKMIERCAGLCKAASFAASFLREARNVRRKGRDADGEAGAPA